MDDRLSKAERGDSPITAESASHTTTTGGLPTDGGGPSADPPTVRDVVYALLREHQLTTIFGNPGSNELPFLSGMPDDFSYVLGLHEGAVLAMADGYALASRKPALVNLHSAAGTGNAMGVLANSVYTHSPLILLAGQQVRSTIGQEVMLTNTGATELAKPLAKWSCEPACAADVPRSISNAIHLATLPPKGPVYVSVPYDDWAHPADLESKHLLDRRINAARCLTDTHVAELAFALDDAASPALVLGPEIDADDASDHAVRLAETLAAPVWMSPSCPRCPFPTRHPSFRGELPAAVRGISDLLAGHDLILVAGAPVFRYHQFDPGRYLPDGARLIHLTGDPNEAARAPVGDAVIADVGDALARIADAVTGGRRPQLPALPDFPVPSAAPDAVSPQALFAALRIHAPRDAVYVNESASTTPAFWSQMDLAHQGSYYFPAAGGLGFGLPAAVGAQLAVPERRVIGVIGDGSANYGITALWTAAHHELPVIIVILKNGTYGALRWFSSVLGVDKAPGLDLPGIDFASVARGYGVNAVSVDAIDGFVAALTAALADKRPTVIEVRTDVAIP